MSARSCPGWGGKECGRPLEHRRRLCDRCRVESRSQTVRRSQLRGKVVVAFQPEDLDVTIMAAEHAWELFGRDRADLPWGAVAAAVHHRDKPDCPLAVGFAHRLTPHALEVSFRALGDMRPYVPGIYWATAEMLRLMPPAARVQCYTFTDQDRRFAERLGFVIEGKMRRARRNDDGTFADAWLMRLEEAE